MLAAALLLPLLALLPVPDDLPRSPATLKDLEKFARDVAAYTEAQDKEDVGAAYESVEKVRDAADKLAKRLKLDTLLAYPGDWQQILERGKAEARDLKAAAGKGFVRHVYEWDGMRVVCMVNVPASYGKGEALCPAILALKPMLGMSGETLEKEAVLLAGKAYAGLLETTLIVIPLGPEPPGGRKPQVREVEGNWMTEEGVKTVFWGLRVLLERVQFDRTRLVLDGWKDAGLDAIQLASSFPSWFAGVINRSGEIGDASVLWSNLGGCVVLYVEGDADARGADLAALRASCDGATELTFIEDEKSAIELTEGGQAQLVEWVSARRRDLAPARIRYALGDTRFQSVAWLTADNINKRATAQPGDPDFPRMEADVDRAANTIRIRTVNVTDLSVFLNDALVDLSKPVVIEVNGKERVKELFQRDLLFLFENRYYNNSGDYGTYVNRASITGIELNLPKAADAGKPK
ncbi:MAG: hypothetical protein FJ296_09810 [Planctomycetes bacterium]|nr:hypothetical protein [Planctomycetota bacterium]